MAMAPPSTSPTSSGRPRLLQAGIDALQQPDVRAKILFTLAMLLIFRFVAHIPVPGVDPEALRRTRALLKAAQAILPDIMEAEGEAFAEGLKSEEAQEAMLAFMERREADFSKF